MLKDILERHALDGKRAFKHDRTKTVGASEIGMCERRTGYMKRGYVPDPKYIDGWGASHRGSTIEEQFWVPALKKHFGKNLHFAGKKQMRLESGMLSAHADALVTGLAPDALDYLGIKDLGPSRCVVVECKSIDPRIALEVAKSEHIFQAQTQMGLFHEK